MSFESLDFIINVLKEHEKDLDRLINQLGIITKSLEHTGDTSGKIEKIEDHLATLQGEITNLINNRAFPREGMTKETCIVLSHFENGEWYILEELTQQINLNKIKAAIIFEFLAEHGFIEIAEKGKKGRLSPQYQIFLKQLRALSTTKPVK